MKNNKKTNITSTSQGLFSVHVVKMQRGGVSEYGRENRVLVTWVWWRRGAFQEAPQSIVNI